MQELEQEWLAKIKMTDSIISAEKERGRKYPERAEALPLGFRHRQWSDTFRRCQSITLELRGQSAPTGVGEHEIFIVPNASHRAVGSKERACLLAGSNDEKEQVQGAPERPYNFIARY
jgi:hypothetical protein